MTNEQTPDERAAGEAAGSEDVAAKRPARGSFRSALRGLRRAAAEVAETGAEEARRLAEAARPEVERRAKQARAAGDAARPRIEQKAREATSYVREHQDEITRASKRGAEVAASTAARAVTPRPLRPAIDAMERELRTPSKEAGGGANEPADTTAAEATDGDAPSSGANGGDETRQADTS